MVLESAAQPRAVDDVLREWRILSYRLAEAEPGEVSRILRRMDALQEEARAATGSMTIESHPTTVRIVRKAGLGS